MEILSVGRRFGSVRALDGVDISVSRGMTLGLVGPNGAGKTTMLRLVLGLLAPDEGSVRVFGMDPWRAGSQVRRRTGAALDGGVLYDRLSIKDSLDFAGRCWRLPARARRSRATQLIEHFRLTGATDRPISTLSRGQRQRAALAGALLASPELLLLDEPTAGLDAGSAELLRESLARLTREEQVTVLLASHNLSEVERLCDKVIVLQRGRVAASGSPSELSGGNASSFEGTLTRMLAGEERQ